VRIVFHFGLFKTGTTSLQYSLYAARERLAKLGVLYPGGGPGRENHRYLTPLCKSPETLEPDVQDAHGGDPARMRETAEALWTEIRREAQRTRPQLLILSTEHMFPDCKAEGFRALRRRLSELTDDVELVFYFREPGAHFASSAQQAIKNGRPPHVFHPHWLENHIPELEDAFERSIAACVGDRDQLTGGDIVVDFLARFVAPVVGPVDVPTITLNESISAEMAAILDQFRRVRYPVPQRRMPDFFSLRSILRPIDTREPRTGMGKLRPEAAEAVRREAVDAIWLRDRYGIVFNGLDYGMIDGRPADPSLRSWTVEQIFEVDPARRARVEAAAMAEALDAWRQLERMPRGLRGAMSSGARLFSRRQRSA